MLTAGIAVGAIPVSLIAQRSAVMGALLGVALALLLAVRVARRPEDGAYALVALAPLTDMAEVVPGSGVRIAYVVLAAALLGWGFAFWRGDEPRPRVHWLLLALLAPAAAGLVTAPFSLDPATSAVYSLRLIGLWAVAAFVAVQMRDDGRVRRLMGTLVATGVALTSVALAQRAFPAAGIGRVHPPVEGDVVGLLRPSAFYLDPNFLAGFLTVAVLCAASLAVGSRIRRDAFVWAAGALACAAGLALTVSRSGWVGLALGALVLLVLTPPRRRLALASVLVSLAVMTAVFVPATAVRFAGGVDASAGIRLTHAEVTFGIARDRPVVGTGLAALDIAYKEAGGTLLTGRVTSPHQLPLAAVAETGVFGLAAQIAILAGLVSSAIARRLRGWAPIDTAVACALVALLAQSLLQYYAYFEPLWLLLALAAAAAVREDVVAESV